MAATYSPKPGSLVDRVMTAKQLAKPVRLELNNSGAWKVLGRFDAADEEQTSLVLDAAEDLIKTLHNSEDPKRCPTLRVSMDHPLEGRCRSEKLHARKTDSDRWRAAKHCADEAGELAQGAG